MSAGLYFATIWLNQNKMKTARNFLFKLLKEGFLLGLFLVFLTPVTFAQNTFNPPTVLPGDNVNIGGYGDACINLAAMIRQGTITLRQIPCFIQFFSQTLIAVAGTISVIFVMIGGFRYVIGSENAKDEAKRTITSALIGLAVSLLAWILVDIVLQFATE